MEEKETLPYTGYPKDGNVEIGFLLDVFIAMNNKVPETVEAFDAWLSSMDMNELVHQFYPGWDLASKAQGIAEAEPGNLKAVYDALLKRVELE